MSTRSDSLEFDDIDLIEEFLVDEPSSSPNSKRSYLSKSHTIEQAGNSVLTSSSLPNYSQSRYDRPRNAAFENGVLYKDEKGNFYRVVTQTPTCSDPSQVIEDKKTLSSPTEQSKQDERERNMASQTTVNTAEKGRGLHPLKAFYLQVGDHRLRFRSVCITGADKMKCTSCKLGFATRSSFLKHSLAQHPESLFHCPFCPRIFMQQHTFDEHKQTHNRATRFNCHLCPKRFVEHSNLMIHLNLHSTGQKNFCPDCEKWFHDEETMLSHNECCSARIRKLEHSERMDVQTAQSTSADKPDTVVRPNAPGNSL